MSIGLKITGFERERKGHEIGVKIECFERETMSFGVQIEGFERERPLVLEVKLEVS